MLISPLGVSVAPPVHLATQGWNMGVQRLRDDEPLDVDWWHPSDAVQTGEYSAGQKRGDEDVVRGTKRYRLALYKRANGAVLVAGHRHLTDDEIARLLSYCDCARCSTFALDVFTRIMRCPCCTGCIKAHDGAYGQHHPGIEARIRRAEERASGALAPRVLTWRQKLQYTDPVCLMGGIMAVAILLRVILLVVR